MKRRGFALMFVVLVLAALELLALATLALATHEAIAVAAEVRGTSDRRAAEAALRRFVRGWPHQQVERLAIGARINLADTSGVSLTIERHAGGLYQVIAAAPTGVSSMRQSMALRTLDVPAALQESAQAMHALGMLPDSLACALPPQLVPASLAPIPGYYAVGGVLWPEAASIADSVVAGTINLDAVDSLGALVPRILYSPADLIAAGRGAGVLLVDGNFTLLSGAEFTGVIIVRATATLAVGSRITGALWAQGQPAALLGQLSYSPCSSAWAVSAAPGSRRLIRAARRFIPAF